MKNILLPLAIALLVLLPSCGGNEEDEARKKEKEQLEEFLNNTKLSFYKAIKIALRSTAVVGKDPELEKARATIMKLGIDMLSVGVQVTDTNKCISPLELLSLATDLYNAKDVLNKTEEDSFPTILGNVYYVLNEGKSSEVPDIFGYKYDNNVEHGIIGVLWMVSLKGPKEFTFYELHKADENKFSFYDLALLMKLSKSLAYYENGFYYHGMDKGDEYISLCEKNKSQIIASPPWSFTDNKVSGEQTYYQIHGMGCLMRGLNEREIGKEEEMLRDFETFLSDAEKGGMDNEITWMIGSYTYVKKEDKGKALSYLAKLEKSELLDQPEKDAVAEIKNYIEKRETGEALNKLSDKVMMGKILFNLVKKRLEKDRQLEQLKQSEEGKKFLRLHDQLNQQSQYLDKLNNNMSGDSLTSKAGDFVKGLFDGK